MLFTNEYQTLHLRLYHFSKYQRKVAKLSRLTKYCVLNKRRKFGAKMFLHYAVIVIFVLGYFILAHHVK